MSRILVIGSTGNVGREVARKLRSLKADVVCGVRDVESARELLGAEFEFVPFDFEDATSVDAVLRGTSSVFLMYPPMLGGTSKLQQFLRAAQTYQVKHVTYLSVKDVQYMPFIPHYHNEKSIRQSGLSYSFLRAGYFMQNLNMFLLNEIRDHGRIYIPAGHGKTSFIDIRDIAEVAALTLMDAQSHSRVSYTLTGNIALDFFDVANIMTRELSRAITYARPSGQEFRKYMYERGLDKGLVDLIARLHFFTKIGLAKGVAPDFARITGHAPGTVEQYVHDYREIWT